MEQYKVENILNDVRVVLDHNDVTIPLEGIDNDTDTRTINEIIERQIIAAARQVVLTAPRKLVEWQSMPTDDAEGHESDHYISVSLPSDFLRFGSAKLSNWKRAINYFVTLSDDEYEKQWSRFAGVRATETRPVCAIVEGYDGGNEVQLFCYKYNSTIQVLTYAGMPVIADGELSLAQVLYEPMVYTLAALVAEVLKDNEKSNQLMMIAKNMLTSAEDAAEAAATNNA